MHNNKKLRDLKMPICKLKSINNPPRAKNYDEEHFYGLHQTVNLAINAKITLTSNLWTNKGLVNGANGFVRDIIYPIDYKEKSLLPSVIFIEFEHYTGPRFFEKNDLRFNWIPINIFDAYSLKWNAHRLQFPFRLAYALTIHKAQGQTLAKAVIDLGDKEMSLGLTFVALSRMKNINDFILKPFPLERLQKISKSISLPPRLSEEIRLNKLTVETLFNNRDLINIFQS